MVNKHVSICFLTHMIRINKGSEFGLTDLSWYTVLLAGTFKYITQITILMFKKEQGDV